MKVGKVRGNGDTVILSTLKLKYQANDFFSPKKLKTDLIVPLCKLLKQFCVSVSSPIK